MVLLAVLAVPLFSHLVVDDPYALCISPASCNYILVMFFVLFVSNVLSCLLYEIRQPCVLLAPFLWLPMVPAYMSFSPSLCQ